MSNQYFSLSYDPFRDGYSTSEWRTLYGDVALVGGQLEFTKAAILGYGDILRGDAIFCINIAAPVPGDNSKFGFTQYSKNAYLYFQITDGVLTAESSNGVDKNSVAIAWNADWTDADTEFRIKWEAGMATFSIGGNFKAVINDITVPGSPMSLYVASDSNDLLLLDYIIVKSIQSYVFSSGNADSKFEISLKESDKLAISSVAVLTLSGAQINKTDSLSISESASATVSSLQLTTPLSTDPISVSESVNVGIPS